MPTGPRDHARNRAELRSKAWQLRSHGWTQARIAEALAVSQSTVSRWFARLEEREHRKLKRRVKLETVHLVDMLDLVVDEGLRAWERSQKPHQRVRRYQSPAGEVTVSTVTERDGNPAFLDVVLAAVDQTCKLLGLYATPDAPVPSSRTRAQTARRLEANAKRFEAEEQAAGRVALPSPEPQGEGARVTFEPVVAPPDAKAH